MIPGNPCLISPSIGPVIDNSLDNVRAIFETNTVSILRIAKTVVPEMAKRKQGLIVNVGSVVGEVYVTC
jgi:short-subunit dehydrogenase